MTDPMCAIGDSDLLGKCTAEIKVSMPEALAEHIAFLATAHGVTKSEYLRELVTEHCLGKVTTIRLRVQRPLRSAG